MARAENQSKSKVSTGPGGRRPGAGRPKGSKNAKTLEIEARARQHAGDALKALVTVATTSESDSARVAAANALLDRAYGRPKQVTKIEGDEDEPIRIVVERA